MTTTTVMTVAEREAKMEKARQAKEEKRRVEEEKEQRAMQERQRAIEEQARARAQNIARKAKEKEEARKAKEREKWEKEFDMRKLERYEELVWKEKNGKISMNEAYSLSNLRKPDSYIRRLQKKYNRSEPEMRCSYGARDDGDYFFDSDLLN